MSHRRGIRHPVPATILLILIACGTGWALASAGDPPARPEETAAPPGGTAEPGEDKTHKNTLKWTTASEQENLGYDIYRSESEDGPFERINEKPVPGAGTTDETNKYEYIDAKIDPRKAYYYYVEAISFDGSRVRFTPIIRAAPKLPVKDRPILPPQRR